MDTPYGSKFLQPAITNVGLVTSVGSHGPNIMAAEWTFFLSHSPGYIGVGIGKNKATHANIMETKEFGVGIASVEQTMLTSLAGGSTGKEVDKIAALTELGIEFYDASEITPQLLKGTAANYECKLIEVAAESGDHTLFIGEVQAAEVFDLAPLAYHQGKYWTMTEQLEKPAAEVREHAQAVIAAHQKS